MRLRLLGLCILFCGCLSDTGNRVGESRVPVLARTSGREDAIAEFRAKTYGLPVHATRPDVLRALGPPHFEMGPSAESASEQALLRELGAVQSIHYLFHPSYATVSFAVGFRDDRMTGTAMVLGANPHSLAVADVEEFWSAEAGDRPVPWR